MGERTTCEHCGCDFTPRNRNRVWCYECMPDHATVTRGEYRTRYAQLSRFTQTGEHGRCCGMDRGGSTHKRLYATVMPVECLYCETPVARSNSYTCAAHADHGKRQRARQYRHTHGRASRNAAKNRRRMQKNLRLLTVIRILERDGSRCALCGFPTSVDGSDPTQLDHVVPVSKGGSNDLSNMQITHRSCNAAKAARLIA